VLATRLVAIRVLEGVRPTIEPNAQIYAICRYTHTPEQVKRFLDLCLVGMCIDVRPDVSARRVPAAMSNSLVRSMLLAK
jgi:hypothetical protein